MRSGVNYEAENYEVSLVGDTLLDSYNTLTIYHSHLQVLAVCFSNFFKYLKIVKLIKIFLKNPFYLFHSMKQNQR